MTSKEMRRRLERSADALVRASVRQIDAWARQGVPLKEIVERLRHFRLPQSEALLLERAVETSMNEILVARQSVAKDLSGGDIEIVKAATQISYPKLEKAVLKDLIAGVQKAIALKSGPDALRHDLEGRHGNAARTLATTSVRQFNNELTFAVSEQSGVTRFLYAGSLGPNTRPFCRRHVGKIYTMEQIEAMDNGQGLPVRSSLGGYNCTHNWVAQPD